MASISRCSLSRLLRRCHIRSVVPLEPLLAPLDHVVRNLLHLLGVDFENQHCIGIDPKHDSPVVFCVAYAQCTAAGTDVRHWLRRGIPNRSPCCSKRNNIPASCRPSAVNGGVLISPCNQTNGFCSGSFRSACCDFAITTSPFSSTYHIPDTVYCQSCEIRFTSAVRVAKLRRVVYGWRGFVR